MTEGLVAYWPFDEGEGEIAQDASGHGHDGRLKNGPQWEEEGKVGGALRFDGLDDVVEVPYSPDFDLQLGLTIVGWFFLEAEPDVGPGNDWRLMVGRNGFKPYGLVLEQSRRLSGSVYIGDERQLLRSEGGLPVGEWVHVAYTYDGARGLARIYLDGLLDAEALQAAGSIDAREHMVRISMPSPKQPQEFRAWEGLIDEVRIYGRALSEEEIQELYESEAK